MRTSVLSCPLALLIASASPLAAAPPARPQAPSASQTTPRSYALPARPSEVLQDLAALRRLATQVQRDLDQDLATLSLQDPAFLIGLHTTLYLAAMVKGDSAPARVHLERVRSLQESPLRKLTTGLITTPLLEAREHPGPDFSTTFRTRLTQRLKALPPAETRFLVEAYAGNLRNSTSEGLIDSVAKGLDGSVQQGRLDEAGVITLLNAGMNLHVLLPVRAEALSCLEAHVQALSKSPLAQQVTRPSLGTLEVRAKGPYLGQSLPGTTPLPFAPEVLKPISAWVAGIAFSPDGTECFLSVGSETYSGAHLYRSTCVNGSWTPLGQPDFLKDFSMSGEAIYSQDGQRLTFTGVGSTRSVDFWTVPRTPGGWGTPAPMPGPINSDAKEWRGSFTAAGVLYFGSDRSSPGINQVHRATRKADQAWVVEKLGAPINGLSYEGDPCVAPDGSWLVFYSGRAGGFGGTDLYISFADGKGGWGTPVNLGPEFNSPVDEWGACLSTDGRFLFFTRHGAKESGIFWVSVAAFEKFRK